MAVQMNISISPSMARFIRNKIKSGDYTNASEVVRAAVRRMQESEAREARMARSRADEILSALTAHDRATLGARVRTGFKRGEFSDYLGRKGLRKFATNVKGRGRKGAL